MSLGSCVRMIALQYSTVQYCTVLYVLDSHLCDLRGHYIYVLLSFSKKSEIRVRQRRVKKNMVVYLVFAFTVRT